MITRHYFTRRIAASLVAIACMSASVGLAAFSETGSEIPIDSIEKLQEIGKDPAYPSDGHYYLAQDIDASATTAWNDDAGFEPQVFRGIFDGRHYGIFGLHINRPEEDYVGLFSKVVGGRVLNLGLYDAEITGQNYVGAFAGENEGVISRCFKSGTVTGVIMAGGLAGKNWGAIEECLAEGTVEATSSSGQAGGIAGTNAGDIDGCFSSGEVSASSWAGGVAGAMSEGTVAGCTSTCAVTGIASSAGGIVGGLIGGSVSRCRMSGTVFGGDETGGIVGECEGPVTDCLAEGNVTGTSHVGGIAGLNRATIARCGAWGTVIGQISTGGAVGYNDGNITDAYAIGAVAGDRYTGGLMGLLYEGNVSRCYAAGYVNGGSDTGGLVGRGDGAAVAASFWDTEASGQEASAGGTGLSTAAMQQQAPFTGAGWNFATVWDIEENATYPWLRSLGGWPDTSEGEGELEGEGEDVFPEGVWLVDVDNAFGAEDGLSWATAFNTILEGLDAAFLAGGGEVWVAEGTYTSPSIYTVYMKPGVRLYGGFAGNETVRDARSVEGHPTTIRGKNAAGCICVKMRDNTVVDGFTITKGLASDYDMDEEVGGGMRISGCVNVEVANCTFTENAGNHGGGLGIIDASPLIRECTFTNNRAYQGYYQGCGGAVAVMSGSPTFIRCRFIENRAVAWNGGDATYYKDPYTGQEYFYNAGNGYDTNGGAVHTRSNDTVTFRDCWFEGNRSLAGNGGQGMAISVYSSNGGAGGSATGAAISALSSSGTLALYNCVFWDNIAQAGLGGAAGTGPNGGAGGNAWGGSINCRDASAAESSNVIVNNCTFWSNGAPGGAGGAPNGPTGSGAGASIRIDGYARPTVTNTVLYGGTPNEVARGTYAPDISYSHTQDNPAHGNPAFVSPDTGDFHLAQNSPCVDAGKLLAECTLDIEGNARGYDGSPIPRGDGSNFDIGAYEYGLFTEGEQEGELEGELEGEIISIAHPADVNQDFHMAMHEAVTCLAGWQQGTYSIALAIRAAYLWQHGSDYRYVPDYPSPLCWQPVNPW